MHALINALVLDLAFVAYSMLTISFYAWVIPFQFKSTISLSLFLCNDLEIDSFSSIRGRHGVVSGDGPRRVHVRGRGGGSGQDDGAEVQAVGAGVYFSGWSSRRVPPGAGEVNFRCSAFSSSAIAFLRRSSITEDYMHVRPAMFCFLL